MFVSDEFAVRADGRFDVVASGLLPRGYLDYTFSPEQGGVFKE